MSHTSPDRNRPSQDGKEASYPPITELVPHAGAMVLLDELVAWSPGRAVCRVRLRSGTALVDDQVLKTPFLIEHMAQAVAACLGYEAYRGGEGVRAGMIVACRNFIAHEASIAVGHLLDIEVSRVRGNDALSHFDCKVTFGNQTAATATLTLFHARGFVETDSLA